MSARNTIRILLGRGRKGHGPLDPQEWHRVAARSAWVEETVAKWRAAQRAMDRRCQAAVSRMSEEEFERLCDEEEKKVEAFRGPLKEAAERDVWPRHLYFGGV